MSSPLLWIVLPGLAAVILFLLRRWERSIHIAGLLICLLLALLAWVLPIGEPISLGVPGLAALRITDTLWVYGRKFVIDAADKPLLMLIYLSLSLWIGGAYAARAHRLFIPVSLGMVALLVAALVVEPTLYAALLITLAALACVPALAPPGQATQKGVLRFLSFQLIGMCFILLSDWTLSLFQVTPNDTSLLAPAALLFGLGLALAGGILPFHTWIPMLAEESHPYVAAFLFYFLPIAIALTSLKYLARFSSLELYPAIQTVLQYAGVMMALAGGIWAAFERNLARILGFAVMVQLGLGLIAISLGTQASQTSPLRSLFFAQLIPQGVALAVWAQALSALRNAQNQPETAPAAAPDLSFRAVQGIAHKLPIASMSLILANFSLAGLPLLASFPGQIALWAALSQRSLPVTLLSLVGSASLFAAGLRSMAVLVMSSEAQTWRIHERGLPAFLLAAGIAILFLIGTTPQWLLPLVAGLDAFTIHIP
jgi:NADH-quinone oxidoreductase subunit N